jgi:chemotaxis protein methyltransferase CheR
MVEFRKLNLAFPWTDVPDADLILMRNVLIYFSVRVKKEVLKRLHRQLRPDGYLMLGAAETTMHLDDTFHVQHLERTTCYRPGKVKPLGFTPIAAPLPRSRR